MWTDELAEKAEAAAKKDDANTLFKITRIISNKNFPKNRSIKEKNGDILISPEKTITLYGRNISTGC